MFVYSCIMCIFEYLKFKFIFCVRDLSYFMYQCEEKVFIHVQKYLAFLISLINF